MALRERERERGRSGQSEAGLVEIPTHLPRRCLHTESRLLFSFALPVWTIRFAGTASPASCSVGVPRPLRFPCILQVVGLLASCIS
ncbi:hypothetical protein Taro_029417 [Colocasia esculenta]|uniref:Uncharacterized protein n=1 Tax=Colocasia esculenta TaxID=4460 RepID=A0A843VP00_COLES|nr:hypothetical protein [Colocasia esculenta]